MIRMSEFVTGIFILAAIAVLVAIAYKPAQSTLGGGDRVTWVAHFDNIALLKDRARVAANGYTIGQVLSRETYLEDLIDPETRVKTTVLKIRVTMAIDRDKAELCKSGTIARIAQESLLGDRFVEIVPTLTGDALELNNGETLVKTEPFGDWTTMLKDLNTPAQELLKNLNDAVVKLNDDNSGLLSTNNLNNISDILANTNTLMVSANETVDLLNKDLKSPEGLLARTTDAADSAANLMAKLDGDYGEIKGRVYDTLGKADTLLDSGNARINRIGEIIEEANPKLQSLLDTAKDRLPGLVDRIEGSLAEVDKVMQGIDEAVRNPDVAGLLYDTRTTMQEMTMTLRALRADFSQLIWGGPGVAQPAVIDPKNDLKNIQSGKPERYGY